MKKRRTSRNLAGLGFEFAAAVAGFAFFGYWIGNHYGRAELGILIGAVLGLIGGMYNLIRATLAASGGAAYRKRNKSSDYKDG
jgi:F0F1-type ATP synthase assembly protein I